MFRCACLADVTSCIMAEESEKIESEVSPLKEPLKKLSLCEMEHSTNG